MVSSNDSINAWARQMSRTDRPYNASDVLEHDLVVMGITAQNLLFTLPAALSQMPPYFHLISPRLRRSVPSVHTLLTCFRHSSLCNVFISCVVCLLVCLYTWFIFFSFSSLICFAVFSLHYVHVWVLSITLYLYMFGYDVSMYILCLALFTHIADCAILCVHISIYRCIFSVFLFCLWSG